MSHAIAMADIQFDTEQEYARQSVQQSESSGLTGLVQKWGLAKDNQQANYVLLGIAIGAFFFTILVFMFSGPDKSTSSQYSPPPGVIIPGP